MIRANLFLRGVLPFVALIAMAGTGMADCMSPSAGEGSFSFNNGRYEVCDGGSWKYFVCASAGVGSCVTLGSCSIAGDLDYDTAQGSYKVCNGTSWVKVGVPDADQTPPTGCPSVGNVCSDGSIFAGDSNLYVASKNDTANKRWSTVSGDTGADSATNGEINQASVVGSGVDLAGTGFELCENMVMHGHSDWYMPSRGEVTTLYNNRAAIDANAIVKMGTYGFLSSTEASNTTEWYRWFSNGAESAINKTTTYARVRCVRRQATSENTRACSSGAGVLDFDGSRKVLRYCDGSWWKALAGNVPGSDLTPIAFAFGDVADAGLNALVTSAAIRISGIDNTAVVWVTGDGSPQIFGGSMSGWASVGSIENFETLQVRLTTSGNPSSPHVVTVNVGDSSSVWTVTTNNGICGGASVGGSCWYLGSSAQSCDNVCSSHGGCNLSGTKNYAGSGGTLANCTSVLNALGKAGSAQNGSDPFMEAPFGCLYDESNSFMQTGNIRLTNLETECGGAQVGVFRACACNN